jgi:hypothetical protein
MCSVSSSGRKPKKPCLMACKSKLWFYINNMIDALATDVSQQTVCYASRVAVAFVP